LRMHDHRLIQMNCPQIRTPTGADSAMAG